MSGLILNTSKDRDPIAPLGNLFQCLTNLTVDQKKPSCIKTLQIFMCFKQCLLPLVLSLHASGNNLALSSLLMGSCRQQLDHPETFSSPGWTDPTAPVSPQMACSSAPDQLGSYSWDFLWGLGSPKPGPVFHECQTEAKDCFLHLWLGKNIANAAQGAPGLLSCKGTLLSHVRLVQ